MGTIIVQNSEMPSRSAPPVPAYELKITLLGVAPPIWRRLLAPGGLRLSGLHLAIQSVMGWENRHQHQFQKLRQYWSNAKYVDEPPIRRSDERRISLMSALRAAGDSIVYTYDFGDKWEHEVRVEKILAPQTVVWHPACLAGERNCPPEEVGGIDGYEQFLQAIFDPSHEDYIESVAWVGGRFQPEEFDLAEANRRLYKKRRRTVRRT